MATKRKNTEIKADTNKNKTGRKSKYNKEIEKELCDYISAGLTDKDSYELAGISKETFYRWMKEFSDFCDSIKRARIEFKKKHVSHISNDESWQSSAWLLERKFPDEWGKQEKINLSIISEEDKRQNEKLMIELGIIKTESELPE